MVKAEIGEEECMVVGDIHGFPKEIIHERLKRTFARSVANDFLREHVNVDEVVDQDTLRVKRSVKCYFMNEEELDEAHDILENIGKNIASYAREDVERLKKMMFYGCK